MAEVEEENKESASPKWEPNPELIQPILEMGINENAAKRGLYYTGNMNVDMAVSWVFDNIDDPSIHTPFVVNFEHMSARRNDSAQACLKMVFAVNSELKMGIGKIAAQVAHAGLAIQRKLLLGEPKLKTMLNEWEEIGATKIVLKGGGTSELAEMDTEAQKAGIPHYLVIDAGKTQVQPASVTVIGIFGISEDVDKITGHLSLL